MPTFNNTIADALAKVTARIQEAVQAAGRHGETVRLIAVSKTHPAEAVKQAYAHGQRDFGENYLQEALEKQAELTSLADIQWHFIGPVQSNKTRPIAENFAWIHSIDREKVAQRLNDQRPVDLVPLQVCLQVNVDDETTKSGVALSDVSNLAKAISQLPRLQLRGLMAIPAASNTPEQQHQAFHKLRTALIELQAQGYTVDTLSMGMSSDLEAAIAEGATMVRVGTDIFGARTNS
ncbi:MAG: YggS family pyridoxal phosphate-dependent enzyme [Moraxellaceae bacterium]|nr:MAG: YggS family pyridoxal phosphate-dependent enzyme [Moraxellaceae bacterium]